MKVRLVGTSQVYDVDVLKTERDGVIQARIDGTDSAIEVVRSFFLRVHGRLAFFDTSGMRDHRGRDTIEVAVGPSHFEFEILPNEAVRRRSGGLLAHEVVAPMPGKVLKILVEEGQQVDHGAPLIVLEAMKMETTLAAESPAIIAKVHAVVGAMVDHGAILIELSPPPPAADSSAT
jgi:biotin carboxyl carrier protein